jgi:hypothetical protein
MKRQGPVLDESTRATKRYRREGGESMEVEVQNPTNDMIRIAIEEELHSVFPNDIRDILTGYLTVSPPWSIQTSGPCFPTTEVELDDTWDVVDLFAADLVLTRWKQKGLSVKYEIMGHIYNYGEGVGVRLRPGVDTCARIPAGSPRNWTVEDPSNDIDAVWKEPVRGLLRSNKLSMDIYGIQEYLD